MTQTTSAGEIGLALADSIREVTRKNVGSANIATFIEGDAPISWDAVSKAGWDQVGQNQGDEQATLRDLVEIGQAWGETLVQLPLLPTIVAKRHSLAAATHSGPVSFSIAVKRLENRGGLVPFGLIDGIKLVADFEVHDSPLIPVEKQASDDFAPSLKLTTSTHITTFSALVANEMAAIWAGEASGAAKRVIRDSVEFAKMRHQFGKPIGSFQTVKHHLANGHIAVEQASTAAIWASLDLSNSNRASTYAVEQSIRALEIAIQVHGGMGFTWEMGLHFYLRHLLTLRELMEGMLRDV